jgi:hypothetical protein
VGLLRIDLITREARLKPARVRSGTRKPPG